MAKTSLTSCVSCCSGFGLICGTRRSASVRVEVPALKRQSSRPTPITPGKVLEFWFGNEPYEVRSLLWLKGMDPADPRTSAAEGIASRYGPWIRCWGADPSGADVPQTWTESTQGLIALVLLFDVFPRLAYEGTAEMFAYGALARKYATLALANDKQMLWPFALFCHVAVVHGEELHAAITASSEIMRLGEDLAVGASGAALANSKQVQKYFYHATAKPAVSLLRQFGRDPKRNLLLKRTSTAAELGWLNTKKDIASWARPPAPPSLLQRALSGSGLVRDPLRRKQLRILVLHGRPQTGKTFDKATKKAFAPLREVAELVFIDAPHAGNIGQGGKAWWDAVETEGAGIKYVGLDASLQHVADFTASEGPFDGVIGFSQGGCLAGIIAALPPDQFVGLNLRFAVIISGFYCRDAGRAGLHLMSQPERHAAPPVVEPRKDAISTPSFHIRGIGDTKVEAWRAKVLRDCFFDAQEATHPGGHQAPDQWPIADVAEWLRQFPPREHAKSSVEAALRDTTSASAFADRCAVLRRLPRLPIKVSVGDKSASSVGVSNSPVALFRCPDVRSSASWARICAAAPVRSTNGITESDMHSLVASAFNSHGSAAVEDLFLLAWHLYPHQSLLSAHRQEPKDMKMSADVRQWGAEKGSSFFWLFHAALAVASDELREEQMWHLATYGGWADLAQLARVMIGSGSAENGNASEERQEMTERVLAQIADVFACQMRDDNTLAAKVLADASADESHSDAANRQIARILDANTGRYALPTNCVRSSPRFKTVLQRVGDMALRVACRLHELRFGASVTDRERFRARLSHEYRDVVRRISHCLELHSAKRLEELQMQEKEMWSRAFLSAEEFKRMRLTPLWDAIVNPVPEPVEIAPAAELQPLYEFLKSDNRLQTNAHGDMTFDRGTLTTDRRLDLCKQVIGPSGVSGLFDALAKDRQSQRHVQHLLLGNNICGEELPTRVAEYIQGGNSQLTTWYIAGNRLTGQSIVPLCRALNTDFQVRQLWLKRNPLRADGARQLADMLRTNTYLETLDVSFCGLLDDGVEELVPAMEVNQGLRHIYFDANGVTERSAARLAKLVAAEDCRLETLSMGLNRFYDGGAISMAGAVKSNSSVKKFCLASCGIGVPGVIALANALRSNRSIIEFDIGFLKATAACGELPNRAEDAGCCALAQTLVENKCLRSLKMSHNAIGLDGRRALRNVLSGGSPNTSLVQLDYEQRGMPRDPQLLRDEVAAALTRNMSALTSADRLQVQNSLRPHHLAEIASVYRLGNVYSPGPAVDDTSRTI